MVSFRSNDANYYPAQVKDVFIHKSSREEKKLQKLFKADPKVRAAFIDWAKEHKETVKQNPRVLKACKIATEIASAEAPVHPPASKISKFVKIFQTKTDSWKNVNERVASPLDTALAKIALGDTVEESDLPLITKNITKVFEAHALGLIDDDCLKKILFSGKPTLLFREGVFKKALPWFKEMVKDSQNLLVEILTKQVTEDTGIGNSKNFKLALPWLKELAQTNEHQLLETFLSHKTGPEGLAAAFANFEEALPILRELSTSAQESVINLFSIKNARGQLMDFSSDDLIILKQFLVDLSKRSPKLVEKLLSLADEKGNTFLHFGWHNKLLKELSKTSPEVVVTLLSIKNQKGETPFDKDNRFGDYIEFFRECPTNLLVKILSIKGKNDKRAIDTFENFDLVLPLLKKLPKEVQKDLFPGGEKTFKILSKLVEFNYAYSDRYYRSVRDITVILPQLTEISEHVPEFIIPILSFHIMYRRCSYGAKSFTFEEMHACLKAFSNSPKILEHLLSVQDEHGKKRIDTYQFFEEFLPTLQTLPLETLNKLFPQGLRSLQTMAKLLEIKNRPDAFDSEENFKEALPILEEASNDFPALTSSLILIKNANHPPALFQPKNFEAAVSWLETLAKKSPDFLTSLLSTVKNFDELRPLMETLSEDSPILDTPYRNGIPMRFYLGRYPPLSVEWLLHSEKSLRPVTPLSEEEYTKKVDEVTKDLDALWKRLSFGNDEGQVSPIYLNLNGKQLEPKAIKKELDEMVRKMRVKEAWLGTPPASDSVAMHVFYCEMLTNFEDLLTNLRINTNPSTIAGPLIDIGKVRVEGRCAAGYQSEIEQARYMAASDFTSMTFDDLLKRQVNAILREIIENIVRENYSGDSHYITQFLYSVKLVSQPDPLSKMDPAACANLVFDAWTPEIVLWKLKESIRRLDREQIQDWFKEHTPKEFNPELVLLSQQVKTEENLLIAERDADLTELSFSPEEFERLTKLFEFPEFAARRVNDANYDEEIAAKETEIQKLAGDVGTARSAMEKQKEAILARALKASKSGQKSLTPLQIKTAIESSEEYKPLKDLNTKLMAAKRALQSLKTGKEGQDSLKSEIRKVLPNLSDAKLSKVLAIKSAFDKKIDAMIKKYSGKVGGVEVSFSLAQEGLPSRGIEYTRQLAYSEQFFNVSETGITLTDKGLVKILEIIGVTEIQTQTKADAQA